MGVADGAQWPINGLLVTIPSNLMMLLYNTRILNGLSFSIQLSAVLEYLFLKFNPNQNQVYKFDSDTEYNR